MCLCRIEGEIQEVLGGQTRSDTVPVKLVGVLEALLRRSLPLAKLPSSPPLGISNPITPALLRRGSDHLPRIGNRHRTSQAPRRARVVPPGALRARVLRRAARRRRARRVLRAHDLGPGPDRPRCVGLVRVG